MYLFHLCEFFYVTKASKDDENGYALKNVMTNTLIHSRLDL